MVSAARLPSYLQVVINPPRQLLNFKTRSALCGAAPTMDALIMGRMIARTGGGGMYLGQLNFLNGLRTLSL